MEVQGQNFTPPIKPDSHLALAIVTTILCCLPFGIVAIIYATKVNSYYEMQQYDKAEKASADAKKYSIIGIVIGLVVGIIYGLFMLFAAGAASSSY